jgi:hypothetical protein
MQLNSLTLRTEDGGFFLNGNFVVITLILVYYTMQSGTQN